MDLTNIQLHGIFFSYNVLFRTSTNTVHINIYCETEISRHSILYFAYICDCCKIIKQYFNSKLNYFTTKILRSIFRPLSRSLINIYVNKKQ